MYAVGVSILHVIIIYNNIILLNYCLISRFYNTRDYEKRKRISMSLVVPISEYYSKVHFCTVDQ